MHKVTKPIAPQLVLVLLLSAGIVAGCSDKSLVEPDESTDASEESLSPTLDDLRSVPPGSLDDRLIQMARDIPGFGGMFYDETGTLAVYVQADATEAGPAALDSRRSEVQAALTAQFGQDIFSRGVAGQERLGQAPSARPEIRILPAEYDVLQLAEWRQSLNRLLSVPGVVLTDLAESKNQVRIGIEPGGSSAAIQAEMEKLGIPSEAVLIEEVAPVEFAKTVRQRFRPNKGGTQISFGGFICTLGFNTTRSGVRGFLTNSHCTNTQGGSESTVYYQPTIRGTYRIGAERRDPQYFTGNGCPAGKRCRYSDTAFARYDPGVKSALAKIARVTGNGTTGGGAGSLTIDDANPNYTIISETAFPAVGDILDKIGRTTGHTYGTVHSTCVNTNVANSDVHLLCQDFVQNAGVGPGDSGSPVFIWNANGQISLSGILWGETTIGGLKSFVFSAMSNIERTQEMGALTTF